MLGTLTASVFVALCVCAALSVWPLWLPGQQAAATLKIDKYPYRYKLPIFDKPLSGQVIRQPIA